MRRFFLTALACVAASVAQAQTTIGSVDTTMRFVGANDKITVERYDDPTIPNVSCYVSRAVTGGAMAAIGMATDPSRFSVACRAVGALSVPDNIPQQQNVFSASASPLFKTITVIRMVDREKKVLIYLVTSTSLVNGSPFNSISAVVYGTKGSD